MVQNYSHFTATEDSLLTSHEPANCSYQSQMNSAYAPLSYYSIILPSTPASSKRPLSFRFLHYKHVLISVLPE